jgi:hypothetical protein
MVEFGVSWMGRLGFHLEQIRSCHRAAARRCHEDKAARAVSMLEASWLHQGAESMAWAALTWLHC